MFNIFKLFGKNQLEKNLSDIYDFAFKTSTEEAILIFNNNKKYCQIEKSKNIFKNGELNNEINSFFPIYKTVSCENLIFSQDLISISQYEEIFYTIGKKEDISLIVEKNKNYIFFEDDVSIKPNDPIEMTIYHILIGTILEKNQIVKLLSFYKHIYKMKFRYKFP